MWVQKKVVEKNDILIPDVKLYEPNIFKNHSSIFYSIIYLHHFVRFWKILFWVGTAGKSISNIVYTKLL